MVVEEELPVNMGMIHHNIGGADVGMVASGDNLADGPIILINNSNNIIIDIHLSIHYQSH